MPGFDHNDATGQPSPEDHAHHGADGAPAPGGSRQLALVKHGHRYVFDYTPGQEADLLERLIQLAHDRDCTLGMFDAAVLSHQVGKALSQQVEEMLKK